MKLKNFFADIFKKFQGGITRFISSFAITVAIFMIISIALLFDIDDDFFIKSTVSLAMGLTFSIFFVVLGERLKINKIVTHLVSLIPTVLCYIILQTDIIEEYFFMGYFGIIFALGCFTLCLLYTDSNKNELIPHILKSIFFDYLMCALLSAGIFVCLFAIQTLIYDFDYEIFGVVASFIWVVIFANTFLAYLPKKDDELVLPKLFKTIIVKITLPVYLFLIVILYIYLIKIVVTRNMPIGQINWFASFASLFFVFFAFCVRPYEDKLSNLFLKFSGFAIIPIIIMQLIAVYERVSAYGLTTPRIISLILVAISIIFALVSIINKKIEKVWWVVGAIILLFTLVPKINIIDMPKQSQINLLEKYLVKNNMLVNNKIVHNSNVEEYDCERIISAFDYLKYSAGKLPVWVEENKDNTYFEIFGFEEINYNDDNIIYCPYSGDFNLIDISEYKNMYVYDEYITPDEEKIIGITIDGIVYECNINELFKQLYDKYGNSYHGIEPVEINENLILYIKDSDFSYNQDVNNVTSCSIHGFFFAK